MNSNRRERILANNKRLECLGFINAETDGDSDCDADDEEDKLRDVGRGSKVRIKALGKKRGKGKPSVRGVKGIQYYKYNGGKESNGVNPHFR